MGSSGSAAVIQVGQHELLVDYTTDVYGPSWWSRVSEGDWENSTLGFVEFGVSRGTSFIDLGAASGLLSLIAARRGAHVFAVEPHPLWGETLERNVALNGLEDKIQIVKAAVSARDGLVTLRKGAKRFILSDISLGHLESYEGAEVEVVSLISLLELVEHGRNNLLIKVDVEGAEYALFADNSSLHALQMSEARVLLSLHPGFPHAKHLSSKVANRLQGHVLRLRGLLDNLAFFYRVRKFADIRLVNGDFIRSGFKFSMLTLSGYFDFVLEFGHHNAVGQ